MNFISFRNTWNERVTHSSIVDVKWKLMKLFFTNDREMRWNEVKFMKFSETVPWEPTKRFIEFSQKWVLVSSSVFQTSKSFSSSRRPSHRPHRRQESRHLQEYGHTYPQLWIPTMECPGNSQVTNLLGFQRLSPRSWWSTDGLNRGFILIILGVSPTHPLGFYFFWKFIGKMLNFSVKKRDYSLTSWPEFSVIIHWQNKPFRTHTLKTSQFRSSRAYASSCLKCWRKHFLELETRDTQLAGVDQHNDRWSWCVNVRRPLLERESWRILLHSVEPALDDEIRVFIVEACASIILALTMIEIELFLTTCAVTSITKLTHPVVVRSDVWILLYLFSGPWCPRLHTTPHTGLHRGQGLGYPLCYPFLPLFYTLKRWHGELLFLPDSELRAQTPRNIQKLMTWDTTMSTPAHQRTRLTPTAVLSHTVVPRSVKKKKGVGRQDTFDWWRIWRSDNVSFPSWSWPYELTVTGLVVVPPVQVSPYVYSHRMKDCKGREKDVLGSSPWQFLWWFYHTRIKKTKV